MAQQCEGGILRLWLEPARLKYRRCVKWSQRFPATIAGIYAFYTQVATGSIETTQFFDLTAEISIVMLKYQVFRYCMFEQIFGT